MSRIAIAAAAAAIIAFAPFADAQTKGAAIAVDEFHDVVTLVSFDRNSRTALLRPLSGKTVEMRVPQGAPILDRMTSGDMVRLHYLNVQAVELTQGGVAGTSEEHRVELAPPGSRPGATFVNTLRTTLSVYQIDTASGIAAVQDAHNSLLMVRIPDEMQTSDPIAEGDSISFVSMETITLEVLPPLKSNER